MTPDLEPEDLLPYDIITYHMRRFQSSDELAGLLVVCMSREGDIVHGHLQRKLLSWHGGDLLWLRHDMLHRKQGLIQHSWCWRWSVVILLLKFEELHLGERSFHTITRYDDTVPLVGAPALKKLSGKTALHHTWRCHHHTRANVIKMVHALQEETPVYTN